MRIDCSITQNFMKEFSRMCKYLPNCRKCGMNLVGEYGITCYEDCMSSLQGEHNTAIIQAIVQDWSDEHPQLTYLEDLLQKHPNAETHENGIPGLCRKVLYQVRCPAETNCYDCWNETMK